MPTPPGPSAIPPASAQAKLRRGAVLGLCLLGALTVLSWAVWRAYHVRDGGEPAEVPRAELVSQEGRLHRVGSARPFTGWMVEYYDANSLKSRSMVSNGVLQGISEGWHTNGQLQVREEFQAGVSHGLRTKWYASGARLSEASIVEGKLQGPFRRWHENGTLAEVAEMREGQPDGVAKAYYQSGYLKAQATVRNGKLLEQKSWDDGERKDTNSVSDGTQ